MKQYKTTIISLIVIAVMIAGFFAVSSMIDKNDSEPQATPTETVETESVFGFSSINEIQSYECNIVDDINLQRDSSGEWLCTTYKDIDLYAAGINTALNSVKSCKAASVYEGEITDEVIKNYEISRTEHIKITLKDGKTYTLRFGMQKPGESMYFAAVMEKEKVYLINSTYKNSATLTLENLLYTQIFNFNDPGKIKTVDVYKKGDLFMSLTSQFTEDNRTWTMKYPLERPGDDSYIEELLSAVTSLFTSEYIEGDCQDLAKYGLEKPAYELVIADNKGTQTLSIGNRVPQGGEFYCIFGGEKNVFTISMEAIAFTDDSVLKYMNPNIFNRMYTTLESIKVEITCGDINETFTMGYDIWEDGEQLYFNEKPLPDDYDTIRAFRRMNTAVYSLDLVGLEPEPEEKGKLLIRITYTMSGTGEVVVVEGYQRDETIMSLYENGVYCGGYDYIRQITGDNNSYGIMGTMENFKTISGMK